MTDDFAHFVIKLFNYKYVSNHFHADLYKVALFLHPRYKVSFENMGTPAAPSSSLNSTSDSAGNVSGGNDATGAAATAANTAAAAAAAAAAAGASGSGTGNDSNFKQILRFACTFIQHFGFDETEIRHLIYQLVLYRDSQIIPTIASNINLSQYWNNLDINTLSSAEDNNGNNGSGSDAANVGPSSANAAVATSAAGTASSGSSSVVPPKSDILKRFASQLFDIVPLIQTNNMKTTMIGMNGLLNGFGTIESPDSNRFITTGYVADIWQKNKFEKRSNYVSMMNAIQIHQSFSR
jgi:hypothetical protein